jgi:hypothetical protein
MKTRNRDANTTPGLPPPPAPTSRDANPWSMGGTQVPDRKAPPPAAATPGRPTRFPTGPPSSVEPRRRPVVPLVILAFVAATALGLVADALKSGRLEDAIGPVVTVVFVAFMIWRAVTRAGRRGS